MRYDYHGLAIFVAVEQTGGFSRAAQRLGLSTSVVSHHVAKLEAKLGVTLLFRSTRSVTLTPEGRKILDAAQRMVSAGDEAFDALSEDSEEPVGALRISMPAFGLMSELHSALWQFGRDHPKIALSLHSSDKTLNLVREGFDLAIRLGQLTDSTLKSRRIGTFYRKIVASPYYLQSHPKISDLSDLLKCEFIRLSMLPSSLTVESGSEQITVALEHTRIDVNAITAGRAAVLAGLGVMVLPLNEIEDDLARGTLVEILPETPPPAMGIFAVWPDSGPQKKLTRRLIEALSENLKQS